MLNPKIDKIIRKQKLSPWQKTITEGILSGKTNKEIAQDLNTTIKTIKSSATIIFKRCEVKNRCQLIVKIYKMALETL